MRNLIRSVVVVFVCALALGAADAQNINVVINGQQVAFTGTPPQELNGSVLVPLRGVFEQLGADVQYNPSTKTIFAQKGSTTVSLSLGSTTAYVDNQPQQLAQAPTVLVGTTLVPLRFVAEAFGAYVEWQPQTSTVEIQTSPSSAEAITPPPAPDQGPPQPGPDQGPPPPGFGDHDHGVLQPVSGRVVNVDITTGPAELTVRTDSGPVKVTVGARTHVARLGADPDAEALTSADIRRGDQVTAKIWPDGTARSIELDYTSFHGRIAALQSLPDGSYVAILDSGQIVAVDSHAVEFQSGQEGQLDLHRGQKASFRVRPGEHRAYSVDVY